MDGVIDGEAEADVEDDHRRRVEVPAGGAHHRADHRQGKDVGDEADQARQRGTKVQRQDCPDDDDLEGQARTEIADQLPDIPRREDRHPGELESPPRVGGLEADEPGIDPVIDPLEGPRANVADPRPHHRHPRRRVDEPVEVRGVEAAPRPLADRPGHRRERHGSDRRVDRLENAVYGRDPVEHPRLPPVEPLRPADDDIGPEGATELLVDVEEGPRRGGAARKGVGDPVVGIEPGGEEAEAERGEEAHRGDPPGVAHRPAGEERRQPRGPARRSSQPHAPEGREGGEEGGEERHRGEARQCPRRRGDAEGAHRLDPRRGQRRKADRRHQARQAAGRADAPDRPGRGGRRPDPPAGAATHVLDEVDRVARPHDEGQRRHHAREDVDLRAAQAQHPHRPHRADQRGNAGDDRRGEAPGHARRENQGQRHPQRVEDENVAAECLRRLGPEGGKACQFGLQPVAFRERPRDPREDPLGGRRGVAAGEEPHEDQRACGIGREEVAGDEWMPRAALERRSTGLLVERPGHPGDDREEGAGQALPPDIEHRAYPLDAVDPRQIVDEVAQVPERDRSEEWARRGPDADDTVAIGGAEAIGDLVDDNEVVAAVAEERPEIVVDPQPGEPHGGEDRTDDGRQDHPASPARVGATSVSSRHGSRSFRRWSSSGSTIHPRQLGAPQRQRIEASAGQQ